MVLIVVVYEHSCRVVVDIASVVVGIFSKQSSIKSATYAFLYVALYESVVIPLALASSPYVAGNGPWNPPF